MTSTDGGDAADLVAIGIPIDLDNCAREPIHIPGSIQPRGVLLVVQEPDLTIDQASTNLPDVLGVPVTDALGAVLTDVIGREAADAIARTASVFGDLRERNPLELEVVIDGSRIGFDVILHRERPGILLIEMELATGPRPFSFANTYLAVRGAVADLNRESGLDELYSITANAVRELTAFDRVMIYRYDGEYNGEVVAEAKRDGLNSFLGLHYPASDIPAQARALYEKNWLRLIDDVDYVPCPVVPVDNPATGEPIDLTYATLRSVSPIHVEYLKNMGVRASMSISLLRHGKLWGLIACHQYGSPHRPPYGTRAAAEFLGSTLSLRLVDRFEDEELRAQLATQAVLAKITAAIQNTVEPIDAGLLGAPDLLDVVAADGIALRIEGRQASRGLVPDDDHLAELVEWLRTQGEGLFDTDCLSQAAGFIALDPAAFSGLLALVLRDGQYVIWFRKEVEQSVDWGGDPANKAIAATEGDDVRISPRKSFERWREQVRSHSLPWAAHERADAANVRQLIVEALYARAEREVRLAETLQRSLLPDLPELSGWTLTAYYEPAAGGRIGGDWYDAFQLADGRLVVVLGDVAGHGIGAAGIMAQLRNVLRAYLVDGASPASAMERLNLFSRLLMPNAFATVALLCIDLESGSMNAVLAGHPAPLLVRDAVPSAVPLVTSPPIGVPDSQYLATDYTVAPGTGFVLFSDGLIERRDEDMFDSLGRLSVAVSQLGDAVTAESVFHSLLEGAAPDDATVLVLRRD